MPKETLNSPKGLIGILSEKEIPYSQEELATLERDFPDEIRKINYGNNKSTDYVVIEMRNGIQLEMIGNPKTKKYCIPREFMND